MRHLRRLVGAASVVFALGGCTLRHSSSYEEQAHEVLSGGVYQKERVDVDGGKSRTAQNYFRIAGETAEHWENDIFRAVRLYKQGGLYEKASRFDDAIRLAQKCGFIARVNALSAQKAEWARQNVSFKK